MLLHIRSYITHDNIKIRRCPERRLCQVHGGISLACHQRLVAVSFEPRETRHYCSPSEYTPFPVHSTGVESPAPMNTQRVNREVIMTNYNHFSQLKNLN